MGQLTRQTSVLSADDLRVGAFVMIHSHIATQHQPARPDGTHREPRTVVILPMALGTLPVLEIRAICLPFVACAMVQGGGAREGLCMVDVRQVRLIKVGKRFATAVAKIKAATPAEALDLALGTGPSVPGEPGDSCAP